MRGKPETQPPMFFVIHVEDRIRADHPLRPIKRMVDEDLTKMTRLFDTAYADTGRPGVPPERLLKALLLQCLYSMRSETALVERIDTDLLFRWFLDMDPAEPVFDQTAFTHNRPRLERHGIVAAFFDGVVRRALGAGLASDEHFSVDGTLIESYASIKSFVPKDQQKKDDKDNKDDEPGAGGGNCFKSRNPEVDFHGQRRSNATHQSTTDPEAKLYRKARGQAAALYHMGHAITENRHGLVMAVEVTEAAGKAEPTAAISMLERIKRRLRLRPRTLGGDKGYDGGPFLLELERRGICPHVPTRGQQKKIGGTCRRSKAMLKRIKPLIAARRRMRRREQTLGYRLSQRCRKKLEEAIGWMKTVAGMCRTRLVGHWKIRQQLHLSAAAYNLVRIRKLAIS